MMIRTVPPGSVASACGSELQIEAARLRALLDKHKEALEILGAEHDALKERYRHLVKELERAGRIQQSLLPNPSDLPIDGYHLAALYRPCEAVGGDFYDILESDEGALILVCDVAGHGLEAALTTMLLKLLFRESARGHAAPEVVLQEMNERLQRVIPSGQFAVAAAVKITVHAPDVQIANAGLPYPFILRAAGRGLEDVSLPGFPLGLLSGARYEARTLALSPADVLLIGTDGIRSIENEHGEHFEASQLRRVLAGLAGRDGQAVIEELMARALAFGNHAPLADDVNLVAVTRGPA